MAYQMNEMEQNIYHLVKEFGSLRVDQAYTINYGLPLATRTRRKKAISNLIVNHRVFYSKDRKYLLINPMATPSEEVSHAMYVAGSYVRLKQAKAGSIYRPEKPAVVGFQNNNGKFFEIVVANEGNIGTYAADIQNQYKNQQIELDERFIRYIFMVKNVNHIKFFPKDTVEYPYAFAVENFVAEDGISLRKHPEIVYHIPTSGSLRSAAAVDDRKEGNENE